MIEFVVGERTFRARKLNPFQQLAILKRIGPLFKGFLGDPGRVKAVREEGLSIELLGAALDGFAALDDKDVEFVIKGCLGAVELKVETEAGRQRGWQQVLATNGEFMFEWIDLPMMMQIAFEVLKLNFEDFFRLSQRPEPAA